MSLAKQKKSAATEDTESAPSADGAVAPWSVPLGLSGRGMAAVAAVIAVINLPLIHYFLFRSVPEASVTVPFTDDFSQGDTVANRYWSSGGHWRVVGGELVSPGVKNNPLWLKAKLPQNVAVEFDVRSQSPEGDIKFEIFGDGSDHASGYVIIYGGWGNQMSVIARLDEHGVPLPELQRQAAGKSLVEAGVFRANTRMRVESPRHVPVQMGQTYRIRLERRGSVMTWFLNGEKYMEFDDPIPLVGEKHDRFGFSSWEAQLYFDNLSIQPL